MKKLLSLDISSSTVGFAYFEYDDQAVTLKDYGYFKPPNKKKSKDCLPYRLDKALQDFDKLLKKYTPDDIAIEDYAKRFSKGKSTAQTIILLATFNELISLAAYQSLHKQAFKYPVTTIRSVLSKHFNEKIVSKDEVYPLIVKYCQSFVPAKNRKGGDAKEAGDIADAIAVGIVCLLKEQKKDVKWNL